MKLALLSALLALPLAAQVRATYEPLAESETKRSTGVKDLTLWNVTVESNQPTVNRGDVERLTAFTELRPSMAEDLVRKASGANSLTLLGKAWDGGSGFVATGLSIGGYLAGSKETAIAGGAVAVVTMFRNLLKGQAPDGTMYLPEFMPDVMTCKGGYCGNFLVLTSKIGSPVRVEVGTIGNAEQNRTAISDLGNQGLIQLDDRIVLVSGIWDAPKVTSQSLVSLPGDHALQQRTTPSIRPIVTHPQIEEEIIYDAPRIAAMIRERSAERARMGAAD